MKRFVSVLVSFILVLSVGSTTVLAASVSDADAGSWVSDPSETGEEIVDETGEEIVDETGEENEGESGSLDAGDAYGDTDLGDEEELALPTQEGDAGLATVADTEAIDGDGANGEGDDGTQSDGTGDGGTSDDGETTDNGETPDDGGTSGEPGDSENPDDNEPSDEPTEITWTDGSVSIEYDDRYTVDELLAKASGLTYDGSYSIYVDEETEGYKIEQESVESHVVSAGAETTTPDTVLSTKKDSDGNVEIVASGVGVSKIYLVPSDAEEVTEGICLTVTVTKATLTLMLLAGQSNMEGWCPTVSEYNYDQSIACTPGTVYSTYMPSSASRGKYITGVTFGTTPSADTASSFVAGALAGENSETSIGGSTLDYAIDSLTTDGNGKTGPDSGLAYEWNALTGDKVWVVNAAYGGTNIADWISGGKYYEIAKAVFQDAQKTYSAEIDNHYTAGKTLIFWLQGETESSSQTAEYYETYFSQMYSSMISDFSPDEIGIIMTRAGNAAASHTDAGDLKMTGPRIAQYLIGASSSYPKAYVVSNANEQWVSDSGVKSYFASANTSYTTHNGTGVTKPTTVAEIHSTIHYSQIGHNENGISAAKGMHDVIYGTSYEKGISWKDASGSTVTSLKLGWSLGDGFAVPASVAEKASVTLSGSAVSYDKNSGALTQKSLGSASLKATSGSTTATLSITVGETCDLSATLGNVTDVVKYNGEWIYVKNGVFDSTYEGVEKNGNGWWYIKDGKVDFTYNGFAKNSNGWWYIEDGKVTFGKTGFIKDTNKAINSSANYWYVVGSRVQTSYTGLMDSSYNGYWYYVSKGEVTNDVTTVAQNKNGWYYVNKSKVDFTYTGFAKNSDGWWYVKDGKVTFDQNGVIKDDKKAINGSADWWYVVGSQVQTAYTGVADYSNSNGWWYVKNGKVDFTYTGFSENVNGRWYVESGKVTLKQNSVIKDAKGTIGSKGDWWYVVGSKVQTSYTGVANYKNANGWWYIKNGKVDFSANTVAKNKNGWWYVVGGKVQLDYTGLANYSNANGWWYIEKGKVRFDYDGIATNKNGTWYIEGGKVQFGYTGRVTVNGRRYTVTKGKVA